MHSKTTQVVSPLVNIQYLQYHYILGILDKIKMWGKLSASAVKLNDKFSISSSFCLELSDS